jgi:hypothetical protein
MSKLLARNCSNAGVRRGICGLYEPIQGLNKLIDCLRSLRSSQPQPSTSVRRWAGQGSNQPVEVCDHILGRIAWERTEPMTYRCAEAGCPMTAVDLPEAAAQAAFLQCHLCGAALSPKTEAAMLRPYPLGLDPESLPTYVAHPWKAYWEEEHPRVRLAWMVDTAELCVRWAVALALAEVRHSQPVGLSADVASRMREHVERPTLGRWLVMLRALYDARPKSPLLVPEVFRLAADIGDRQFASEGTAETSLLVLRNEVAHGGGLSSSRARELLRSHRERFESLLRAVSEVTHDVEVVAVDDQGAVKLRGTTPQRLDREALPADVRGCYLVGQKGTEEKVTLPLWPFAAFGLVRLLDGNGALVEQAGDAAPLIYSRSDRESLDYTPLGRDEFHSVDLDVTDFRNLFRLDEARTKLKGDLIDGSLPGDLLAEAMVEEMVGRRQELEIAKDWLQRRDGRTQGAARVGWISGGPGMGKSMLVARVAGDLSHAPADRQGLFFHRFRAGDGRNSRSSFLRLLQAALWQWEPLRVVTETPSVEAIADRTLEEDVKARLAKVVDLPPSRPKAQRPRFLVFADGLDELAPLDPGFPDLVKDLALPGTVWMLAGRPEQGLTLAFDAPGCDAVFGPGGLPLMSPGDIREMLEVGLGLGRHALLTRDNEVDGTIVNTFVDRVVDRAQGLPIYVHLLLEDMRQGHLSIADEEKLPAGLDAYYDQILSRIGLSTVRHDLSALVCYLARAAEPLDADAIAILVAGGPRIADDLGYRRRVADALRTGRSLLRLAPTNDGGDGWTLYHQSFREYVAGRPDTPTEQALLPAPALGGLVHEAEYRLVRAAEWWADLPPGNLRNHAFRRGVQYALKWGGEEGLQAARARISDFAYLMARTGALPTAEITGLGADFVMILDRLSGPARDEFRDWEAFVRERSHILRRGTPQWPANRILLQLAIEHADDSIVTRQAEAWLAEGHCTWLWLRNPRRVEHAAPNPCLQVFEGHTARVSGALLLSGGRILSWSWDETLRIWSLDGSPVMNLEGHTGWVWGALSLSEGRILTWARDHTLRIWSSDGVPVATLEGHTNSVFGALLLADGRILSWSEDKTLRLWSPVGAPMVTLAGHTDEVGGALLLPDGSILSWSDDKTLRFWSPDGAPMATLQGHTSAVSGASLLSDGRILSRSWDKTLRLWSPNGSPIATLEGHTDWPSGALPLADGRILSWSRDTTLRLWSPDGAPLATLEGHSYAVYGALLLSDGRILSWSEDNTPRLWSSDGTLLATLKGHRREVHGALLLPDGRILSWSADGTLRLWSSEGTSLATLDGHTEWFEGVLLLPDGRILSWSADRTLRLWSPEGTSLATLEGHGDGVSGVRCLPDGRILSWSNDKTLRLWSPDGAPLTTLEGHTEGVWDTLLLTDGRILSLSGSTFRLWSLDGAPLASLEGHRWTDLIGARLLPDSRILSWSGDHTLRLWSPDGAPLATLKGHTEGVWGALVLPDGRILSWSSDKTLRVWSPHGAPIATLEGHTDWLAGALPLPDGRILSWSSDKTLRLWSHDAVPLVVLEGHTGASEGALLLADGRILSWSGDKTLRLWSADGVPLATLEGHTDNIEGALCFPDGQILSWSGYYEKNFPRDKALRLWSPDGAALAAYNEQTAPDWIMTARVGADLVQDGLPVRAGNRFVAVAGAAWHGNTDTDRRAFLADGTVVVTLSSGHVFCLKLHQGAVRATATEAAQIARTSCEKFICGR